MKTLTQNFNYLYSQISLNYKTGKWLNFSFSNIIFSSYIGLGVLFFAPYIVLLDMSTIL